MVVIDGWKRHAARFSCPQLRISCLFGTWKDQTVHASFDHQVWQSLSLLFRSHRAWRHQENTRTTHRHKPAAVGCIQPHQDVVCAVSTRLGPPLCSPAISGNNHFPQLSPETASAELLLVLLRRPAMPCCVVQREARFCNGHMRVKSLRHRLEAWGPLRAVSEAEMGTSTQGPAF